MAVKFGVKQLSKPTPLGYKRFLNVMIIIIVPSTATIITQIPSLALSDEWIIFIGLMSIYITGLLKAVGMLLGIDEVPPQDPK